MFKSKVNFERLRSPRNKGLVHTFSQNLQKSSLNFSQIHKEWAPPDLNRSLCLPKAQVYQANPRARSHPILFPIIKVTVIHAQPTVMPDNKGKSAEIDRNRNKEKKPE